MLSCVTRKFCCTLTLCDFFPPIAVNRKIYDLRTYGERNYFRNRDMITAVRERLKDMNFHLKKKAIVM